MKEIRTEIFIEADMSKVWEVLMDFSSFSEWNPFMTQAKGSREPGKTLEIVIMNGQKPMTIKPRVTELEQEKKFAWLGSLALGAFNGNHIFELQEQVGGTLFIHRERFSGWLTGLILKQIGDTTRNGFIEMNRALKARAEGLGLSDD